MLITWWWMAGWKRPVKCSYRYWQWLRRSMGKRMCITIWVWLPTRWHWARANSMKRLWNCTLGPLKGLRRFYPRNTRNGCKSKDIMRLCSGRLGRGTNHWECKKIFCSWAATCSDRMIRRHLPLWENWLRTWRLKASIRRPRNGKSASWTTTSSMMDYPLNKSETSYKVIIHSMKEH